MELKIPYTVIHNASVMNAIGACGLALYNFGQTISIPFFTDNWRPSSWLGRIQENLQHDLHTLCLLDIKVKEQSEENMARSVEPLVDNSIFTDTSLFSGRKIYEPARYMSPATALEQLASLLPADEARDLKAETTLVVTVSRLGTDTQQFVAGTLSELLLLPESHFGSPLHSMVIVGKRLNPIERDFLQQFALHPDKWISHCLAYGCT